MIERYVVFINFSKNKFFEEFCYVRENCNAPVVGRVPKILVGPFWNWNDKARAEILRKVASENNTGKDKGEPFDKEGPSEHQVFWINPIRASGFLQFESFKSILDIGSRERKAFPMR